MSSNNNNKKSNAIRDAAAFTAVAGHIHFLDTKAKFRDPNTHYNPETDTVEPGA
jgi:hypothetical protein